MKTRRGISSVVGTVFSIIALATTITYVTYSLDVLDKFNQGVLSRNEETIDRGKEQFEVLSATIQTGKFNITISNTGTLPINITKLWVQNTSATDWVNGYDIKKSVAPDGILKNIGQNSPLTALTTKAYNMKLVTERGNTLEFSVNSGNSQPLYMQLHALPSKIATGFTTTLLLEVVNNQSSNDLLLNLKPKPLVVTPQGSAVAVQVPGSWPVPTTYSSLTQGDVAYFKWIYDVDGNAGETVTFQAELENGYPNNKAIAVVTLEDVAYATESETSIESEGLTCCRTSDDIIVLHKETDDTPGNVYQMYSGSSDTIGFTIDLETVSPSVSFFTNNDTISTVDVPSGVWNATFRYRSSAMPDLLQANPPNMIFHFTTHNPATPDSSGNNNALTVTGPDHSSTGGVHGLGYYTFVRSNVDYMSITRSTTHNHIDASTDSTAGWFRVSSAPPSLSKYIIYKIEGATDYYEISMDDQRRIVFEYKTDATTTVTCQSAAVSINAWHFFAAVRNGPKLCKLYIDTLAPISGGPGGGNQQDTVDTSTNVFIGKDPDNPPPLEYAFDGDMDYIMHWNGYALPSDAAVLELYNANYGTKSHTVDIRLDKTDKDGNLIYNFVTKQNFNFTFGDGKGSSTTWALQNYTVFLTNSSDSEGKFHFTPNQRLKLNVAWDAAANDGELDMDWRIDDNTLTNQVVSILQIPPPPSGGFASYFKYDNDFDLQFAIENTGPDGIWIIYGGTRVMFENLVGGTSYGGLIKSWNDTNSNMNPETDSTFLPVYGRFDLRFYVPRETPTSSEAVADRVLPGNYRMYVSVVGYDEKGANVFRTFYVGIVRVVD
jgi:hypothetical protein